MEFEDILRTGASWLMPRSARIALARVFINTKIKRYGEMTQLTIDNTNKTIKSELLLAGEKEPITLSVGHYELGGDGSITLSRVSVSREWMNLLAQDMLANKPLPVPPAAAKWLRLVL